ncbi:uroporphyrinogen-III synthase [Methanimicrococcus blatticola]|uniref:Uroporphyrinogen-III synthase n=1 Tax=Methanimicrococcus blatticola TaxID=91560 RepID=A0A484F3Y2_9EURY|nr:uroporphyrinogen-III synthase [Methanimicrococcus blatticola]MBZ3935976.1 uroporphyrinogen-III synthase [Methanimicrococcus blatticola]MCC2509411.1 uroporphyrinogen-III synthase [Methanimicrococcus blatticola]TDQ68293.1 uroporphyrinogen-III synthase [Methanimicrococcus blatticola]
MEKRPVLAIMRPETYTNDSERVAEDAGFQPFSVPVVTLRGMKDDAFDGFVQRVLSQKTDIVIFTSANGIDYTLKNLDGVSENDFLSALKKIKIVAIGPTTRKKLESCGLTSSLMPGEYSSEGLVNDLGKDVDGKIIDIPRSFYGSEVLVKGLIDAGATVHQTHVYTLDIPEGPLQDELIEKTVAGEIDAFAFTSTMMVKNFMKMAENNGELEDVVEKLNEAVVGAIGYPTAQTVESFGVTVDVVPGEFTFEALVEAIRGKMK